MVTRTAVVFDADNILWDTNAVFRRAQLGLLQVFVKAGLVNEAEAALPNLRLMDKVLAKRYGKFEYDLASLPTALHRPYCSQETLNEAAEWTIQRSHQPTELIKSSCEVFSRVLKEIPHLFEDAEEVLRALQALRLAGSPIITLMFSEGEPARINRIIEAYNLRNGELFDEIILATKSLESYENVRLRALRRLSCVADDPNALFVMIGDSLQRDVVLANRTGFVTIYKLSSFLGEEISSSKEEEPSFRIGSLLELPRVLRRLGVQL